MVGKALEWAAEGNACQWVFCVAKLPEVDIRSFLQLLSALFFEIEFLPGTQRTSSLAKVTDQVSQGSCCPCLPSTVITGGCYYAWHFMWVLETGLRSSCVSNKYFMNESSPQSLTQCSTSKKELHLNSELGVEADEGAGTQDSYKIRAKMFQYIYIYICIQDIYAGYICM